MKFFQDKQFFSVLLSVQTICLVFVVVIIIIIIIIIITFIYIQLKFIR